MDTKSLIAQRKDLAGMVVVLGGARPGSRGWNEMRAAEQALVNFDAAHPEILPLIQSAHSARLASQRTGEVD